MKEHCFPYLSSRRFSSYALTLSYSSLWVFFLLPTSTRGAIVELLDGSRISTRSVLYKDDNLICDEGRSIPRDQVKTVLVGREMTTSNYNGDVGRSDIRELLRQAEAAAKKYPDVGSITLIDDGEFIYRQDGTTFERSHYAIKILKEEWKSIAEIAYGFEEGRNRATLVRARAIAPDGTVTAFDPADLKESKPMSGMDTFDAYRMLSGQLANVKVGSIVEIIWDNETYNPYGKDLFYPGWAFGSTEPTLWSRVTIRIPKSRTLNYRTENMPEEVAEPKITETATDRIYRWEMRDIAPVVAEPLMPPIRQVVPGLIASLHEDWNYLYDYLGKFQKEHIKGTPSIEARVAEIIGDASSPEEKIERIYYWLQREIRYVSIKASMGSAWSGHPANLTLENGYGDCIDKAILFSTMLQAVGVTSYPVLLATNDSPAEDRSLPRLYANHAINKVYLGDRSFYLDSTAETYRYPYFRADDHGVSTINVLEREIGEIEVPPPDDNALDIHLDMTLSVDGDVDTDVAIGMTGSVEAGLRSGLEQINKMLLKMAAQQAINAISPGALLQKIDISDETDLTVPLTVQMKVRLPEYPSYAGDLMIFRLPLSEGIHQFPQTSLEERQFDIDYHSSSRVDQHVRLHLPDGFEAKGLPDPLRLRSPYIDFDASFSRDGDTVVYEDSMRQPRRIVPKEDYAAHKALLERIANYSRKPIFLRKSKSGPT